MAERLVPGNGHAPLIDDQLLDAMLEQRILIRRPFVVTQNDVRLCRLLELVLEILPALQQNPFTKGGGKKV